jgi:hypothetical protein
VPAALASRSQQLGDAFGPQARSLSELLHCVKSRLQTGISVTFSELKLNTITQNHDMHPGVTSPRLAAPLDHMRTHNCDKLAHKKCIHRSLRPNRRRGGK